MKAVIISDKQDVIKLLQKRLESEGFDVIIYRWLLKALDNIEEIRPDYIILSAEEYPRHWKTLASFVQSGIGGNDVRFCLYNDEILNAEDKQKAEQLGVEFYSEQKEVPEVEETTEVEEELVPTVETVFTENEQKVEEIAKNYSLVITDPENGKFVTGTAIQESFDTFNCSVKLENLSINQTIKYISVSDKVNSLSFSGEIVGIQENNVSVKVLNYYE